MNGIVQIDTDPAPKTLKHFGFIWLGFLTVFGVLAWFKAEAHAAAVVLWALAVIVPVIGWTFPAVMRLIYLGLSYAAWPIGFVVSHVILALVFYLVVTPIGLVMRLVGYDPMERGFDHDTESYWVARDPKTADPKRYFRQS